MDVDELYKLLWIIGKLILDGICIAAWIVMTWWVCEYLTRIFPLEGFPKYMLYAIEIIFWAATLVSLIKLLFLPHKNYYKRPWWYE